MDNLKKYWFVFCLFGAVVASSNHLMAMWETPEQLQKTQESVENLSRNIDIYIAKSESEKDKTKEMISILVELAKK